MTRLKDEEISEALKGLSDWSREGDALERRLTFESFPDAVAFLVRLAFDAESADHHPDVMISYRRVVVRYWTHDSGGITAKDVEAAKRLDRILD
jgi:4a-hydroxytetrahydrobiopterin dehydratase